MLFCKNCSAENTDDKKFCGECGTALEAAAGPVAVPGEDGAFYCDRHKKVVTRVRCGRCEKPICPRCTVFGPAGTRCRDCARNRVPIRPMGVLHEVTRSIDSPGPARTVWYLAIWSLFLHIFSGLFGGRHD